MQPIFITGIGTGIGKTIVSAIIAEALECDYWKPVQAGFDEGTDSLFVQNIISNSGTVIHPEIYKLKLAASPHIAARDEQLVIDLDLICERYAQLVKAGRQMVIEGAGGLMVPLNEREFVADLIKKLNAKVILVSRNYLGSINHSLLTAMVCKTQQLNVAGWVFNDQYMQYEDEIAKWSGYKKIASVPHSASVTPAFIKSEAGKIKGSLLSALS